MLRILRELLPSKLRNSLREKSLIRKAVAQNEIFYCRALSGESDYNICINSDLTVSCNCQDFDGSGHIGDLNSHTLEQIFSGPTANKFRSLLAARKFPIPTCSHCSDLKAIPASEVNVALSKDHVPDNGIMVENTVLCNLRCHMCNREKFMELRSGKLSLSLSDVEKIALLLKEYGFKRLLYFNLGEPFLPTDILEQIKIIRKYNPEIRIITSTNGQLLDKSNKIEAALMMDYIFVSLDGVNQDTVSKYQVGGNFETAYQNIATLVAERNKLGKRTPIVKWRRLLGQVYKQ